jgi:hypothetical protein
MPSTGQTIGRFMGKIDNISNQLIFKVNWRRERDSNPRYGCPHTDLANQRLQPLGHLSAVEWCCYTLYARPIYDRRTPLSTTGGISERKCAKRDFSRLNDRQI